MPEEIKNPNNKVERSYEGKYYAFWRGPSITGVFCTRIFRLPFICFFSRWRLRRCTPGPPPFSSMNSMAVFSHWRGAHPQ